MLFCFYLCLFGDKLSSVVNSLTKAKSAVELSSLIGLISFSFKENKSKTNNFFCVSQLGGKNASVQFLTKRTEGQRYQPDFQSYRHDSSQHEDACFQTVSCSPVSPAAPGGGDRSEPSHLGLNSRGRWSSAGNFHTPHLKHCNHECSFFLDYRVFCQKA